jgi:hypothetical protein
MYWLFIQYIGKRHCCHRATLPGRAGVGCLAALGANGEPGISGSKIVKRI